MIYGYSVAVMRDDTDRRWRAVVMRDVQTGEDRPGVWSGYGSTEREAINAAFDQIDFAAEPPA